MRTFILIATVIVSDSVSGISHLYHHHHPPFHRTRDNIRLHCVQPYLMQHHCKSACGWTPSQFMIIIARTCVRVTFRVPRLTPVVQAYEKPSGDDVAFAKRHSRWERSDSLFCEPAGKVMYPTSAQSCTTACSLAGGS